MEKARPGSFVGSRPGGMREAPDAPQGPNLQDLVPSESVTAGSLKACRRIQPAEREPRRRPNGDILHAQRVESRKS